MKTVLYKKKLDLKGEKMNTKSAIYCSALFCSESIAQGETSQVSFHSFPRDASLLSKWLKNLNRKRYTPTSSSKVCSQHFTPQSFLTKTQLKHNAVPTLFFSNGPKLATRAYNRVRATPGSVTLENQADCNDSSMMISPCDPPEATQVFSDEEDDWGRPLELEVVYDEEAEFSSDHVSPCRTCGLITRDSTGIFSPEGIRQHLQYKINTNLPIKVSVDDSLSTLICRTCLERLQACHLIRESSRRADIQLKASMAVRKVLVNYCPDIETTASELVQQLKHKFISSMPYQNFTSQPSEQVMPEFVDVSSLSPECAPSPEPESALSPEPECAPSPGPESAPSPVPEQNYAISPIGVSPFDFEMQILSRQSTVQIPALQFQAALRQEENIGTESNKSKVAPRQVLGAAIVLAGIGCESQKRKKQNDKRKSSKQVVGKAAKKLKTIEPQLTDDLIKFQNTSGMSCKDLTALQEKLQEDIKKVEESMQEKEQSFTCSECSSSFTVEHLYNVHLMHHGIEKKKMIYTCYICKHKFWSAYLLAEHKKSSHYLAKTFSCEPCNKTFKRKDVYQAHLNNRHSTQRYTCHLCSKQFAVIYDLKYHIKYHERTKCGKCGRYLKTVEGLKFHQARFCLLPDGADTPRLPTSLTDGPASCPECGDQFETDDFMRRHLIFKHTNSQHIPHSECIIREKKLSDVAYTPRLPTSLTDGPVSCPECGDQFQTDGFMRRHLIIKHPNSQYIRHSKCNIREKSFVCEVCNQAFSSKAYLMTHMNVHTKAKLYKCPHCDKTSYHKANHVVHVKTHSDIRPYACTYCDNKFKRRDALNMHIRIHTGEKPNICQYCGKGFIQPGDLKLHVKRHLVENTSRKRKTATFAS